MKTHLVANKDNPVIQERLMEGGMVPTICGVSWDPSKDPPGLEMCQKCVDLVDFTQPILRSN